ncbi:hypothetical protein BFJ66_g14482 [Fusarium oxysporum f. sp. cepae]|nr:hypothetical protein BFJ67_g15460 [Fusarium oxysporum f. sp. cepae]RKK34323.1 hypothetical protein BFJ66_g14482 [Fusarium oxysporum f. sp. cepae]
MKYGQRLEHKSVPEWSLHNLDYNLLKHEIKVHTSHDQTTALAIPGHQDPTLRKFEDEFYTELCRQRDRLGLFATGKAEEISLYLEHISRSIHRWISKPKDQLTVGASLKYQKRFTKLEREVVCCSRDIQLLSRFANAQVVGFRKIIKKYKKWTGSTTLGSRFSENVLSEPKSFTKRDFTSLHTQYDEISLTLHASAPVVIESSSPESIQPPLSDSVGLSCRNRREPGFDPPPLPAMTKHAQWWNEYDDGSECGSPNDEYMIYVNPEDAIFPGLDCVQGILKLPIEKARKWLKLDKGDERQPLLVPNMSSIGYSSAAVNDESDVEGRASSECYLPSGHVAYSAINRYGKNVLFWSTVGCLVASYALSCLWHPDLHRQA